MIDNPYLEEGPIELTEWMLENNGFTKVEIEPDSFVWVLEDECGDNILSLYRISNGFCTNLMHGMTLCFRTVEDLEQMFKVMGSNKNIEI